MNKISCMWRYFKKIVKHKYYVGRECAKCGLFWQGLIHDNSKFSLAEFVPSALYWEQSNEDRDPIKTAEIKYRYSLAWQHHKGHNPHHWEYWMDYGKKGRGTAMKIPYNYAIEMICDWVGASIAYGDGEWSSERFYHYYLKNQENRRFHKDTAILIERLVTDICNYGLDDFHGAVKDKGVRRLYNGWGYGDDE